jgi:hypothetical protein
VTGPESIQTCLFSVEKATTDVIDSSYVGDLSQSKSSSVVGGKEGRKMPYNTNTLQNAKHFVINPVGS